MDAELLRVVGSVAGIGGLGLGIVLLLYQEVLRARVLRRLTKQQAYRLLTLVLLLVFLIALLALLAYIVTLRSAPPSAVSACVPLPYGMPLRTIISRPGAAWGLCDGVDVRLQTSRGWVNRYAVVNSLLTLFRPRSLR